MTLRGRYTPFNLAAFNARLDHGTLSGLGDSDHSLQQTITVAKSGGDFTTIQGAIDSITDAADDKRYCVLIYPGDYAETVVGKSYVELMGLAAREAVNITGATGPLYTFPNNEGHIFNLKFSLSPTTASQKIIYVPSTVVSRQVISNCLFVLSTASDVASSIFDVDGGEVEFINNKVLFSNTNTANGSARVQKVWDVNGDSIIDIYGNIVDIDIYDITDRVLVFDDASTTGGEIHIKENVIRVDSHNAGAYSGIVRFITYSGETATLHVAHNFVELTSAESGGTGTADFIRLNSGGTGVVRSTANHVIVSGFATNYWANVVNAADTVISHFDNFVAVDGSTGSGTVTYANSLSDGSITATGTLDANASNIGPVTLKAGTAAANTGPLKFTAGTALTTPEAGVLEFHDDRLHLTNVACRRAIDRTSCVETSTTTVTNTTDETTIYTCPCVANALKAGNHIHIEVNGIISNATAADDITIKIYVGTDLISSYNPAIGLVANDDWHAGIEMTVRTVGESGTIASHGHVVIDGNEDVANELDTIDTTAANDITVTVQWDNAKAGNTISLYQGAAHWSN